VSGSGPRLGVVGSANVDLVVRCAHLPRPGETVLGGDVTRLPGGKGANQAAAAAALGARVTLLACLGDDDAGDWLAEGLAERGVDTTQLSRSDRPTGTALITVADDGENQIVVAPGANRDLDLAGRDVEGYDVVLAQLEVDPAVVSETARRARRLVLNVAPAVAVDAETLARAAVVIANETEAEALDLRALAHCVVTMGARGAAVLERGWEVARATAPPVTPVDTVGAGDVFSAAYAVRLASGDEPASALRYAVAAGSLATTARGAQGALPSDEEVRRCLSGA
jgi:ribokinase